ncbi:MAG TPA: sodium:proton antiporter [Acidocella sp.]|nr:MAG: sodium:proton antiporter [Rhodospirillales bacterium 20-64-7]HQT46982.1 sodium:proton antiporter [Acidocella sp.]
MGQLVQAIPFAGVLLSFAVFPGLFPRLWHRRMAAIIGSFVALYLALNASVSSADHAIAELWQVTLAEFLPFILLLLALYALGGGIGIKGGPWGRPAGNCLLLVIGSFLASIMGTIGASLLLIHPLLAANAHRRETRHLVLAFIILIGNAGGALSPLGDPPLLVGFLRGVPFLWPLLHLWGPLLLLAVPVLALCTAIDFYLARREPSPRLQPFRIRGRVNITLLVLLCAVIPLEGVWHPGDVEMLGARIAGEHLAVMLLEVGCISLSEWRTPRAIRNQNRFAWSAMREIIILFFAVFATIAPAFRLLQSAHLAPMPLAWFWASGIASAVLDAAPTYLVFFQAAGGDAAALIKPPAHLLSALAAGSVFFGPVTYLGNAPNLMIRAIASRRGVRMPGFFSYSGIMILLLTPIFGLMGILFF